MQLLHNRNFLYLFLGGVFASPGFFIFLIATEWLMLELTSSKFMFGMLFVSLSIPRLVLMVLGGVLSDRFDNRYILFTSDIGRFAMLAVLVVLIFTNVVAPWHLILVSVFFGVFDAFSYPAGNAILPEILEKRDLHKGNGMLQLIGQLSPIVGSTLAGVVIGMFGYIYVYFLAGIFLLFGAFLVVRIRFKDTNVKIDSENKRGTTLMSTLSIVYNDKTILKWFVMSFSLYFLILGPFTMGIPLLVKNEYMGNATEFGFAQSAFALGVFVALGILFVINLRKSPELYIYTFVFVLSGFGMALGVVHDIKLLFLFLLFCGCLLQMSTILLLSEIQRSSHKKIMGKLMGIYVTVTTGIIPVSYIMVSFLLKSFSMSNIVVGLSFSLLLLMVFLKMFFKKGNP